MKFIFLFSYLITFLLFNEEAPKGTLFVEIEGIEKIEGNIGLLIFNKEAGFPESSENAFMELEVRVTSKNMKIDLGKLPFGNYAIAIVHDVNSNNTLDKNLVGIPKEPFGFSNNKSIFFGLPKFQEAAVSLNAKEIETKIKLIDLYP